MTFLVTEEVIRKTFDTKRNLNKIKDNENQDAVFDACSNF